MREVNARRGFGKQIQLWLLEWCLCAAAWLLFTSSFEPAELLIGIVAAAIGATASHVVWANHLAQFTAQTRSLLEAWRLPWYAVSGTFEILPVLLRQLSGGRRAESLLQTVPFDTGGNDEESATRRALAIAYTTCTPNFIVVGIDRERGVLLYHRLTAGPVLRMTRNLGARG